MKSMRRMETLTILVARIRVVLFQLRRMASRRPEFWCEEICKEPLVHRGRPVIVYVGACLKPEGARWPFDPRIKRVQFYNRPPVRIPTDEHATQHL
jgi:hypothetical protein